MLGRQNDSHSLKIQKSSNLKGRDSREVSKKSLRVPCACPGAQARFFSHHTRPTGTASGVRASGAQLTR